ncbi:hypothetical protein CBL_11800 [Carabus blaptoides fortunei]
MRVVGVESSGKRTPCKLHEESEKTIAALVSRLVLIYVHDHLALSDMSHLNKSAGCIMVQSPEAAGARIHKCEPEERPRRPVIIQLTRSLHVYRNNCPTKLQLSD